MSTAPIYHVDLPKFWADPYPDLKEMRARAPICFVPELNATLITRRDMIFNEEKKIDVFSSQQPNGLMTRLMGENMMRKDGDAHMQERKAIFPSVSPKTVKNVWQDQFEMAADQCLADIFAQGRADMVKDIAMRISGEALKSITGLTNMTWQEMDRVSQGMIDGCANYAGNPEIEEKCHDCTASIDRHISEMKGRLLRAPDHSLLSVQMKAGLSDAVIRANIKLAISGGQNEPRDAIAGVVWALLNNRDQLDMIFNGNATWRMAFEEYARWNSPIGMAPREVAREYTLAGVDFYVGDRVFLMFGSGNRDEDVFARPDEFDLTQDCGPSVAFGAGPHFCAGAWASRVLIADVALPKIFAKLSNLSIDGDVPFGGWAFRGPLSMPVRWDVDRP
jgi:cytochrome P450